MGKRKERRLAAKQAAGRRVKLDLFAEPSGEAEGGSSRDEVGRDLGQDNNAGVPTSPSSSGLRQENPLLLLGQYSDDEMNDEATDQPKHADETSSLTDSDDQVEEPVDVSGVVGSVAERDIHDGVAKQDSDEFGITKSEDNNGNLEIDVCSTANEQDETHSNTQLHDLQPSGSNNSDIEGWKMVMDQPSSRYYYWNTLTGETSWVVPTALSLGAEITGEQSVPSDVERKDSIIDTQVSTHLSTALTTYADAAASNQIVRNDLMSGSIEGYALGTGNGTEGGAPSAYDANHSLLNYGSNLVALSYGNTSALPMFDSSQQLDTFSSEHEGKQLMGSSGSYETADGQPSRLVRYCEGLLQRLNALEGSGHKNVGDGLIKKEVEMRLFDCSALLLYGPSLLPFWWHTEMQLRRLESDISQMEISRSDKEPEQVKSVGSGNGQSLPENTSGVSVAIPDEKTELNVENSLTPASDAQELQIEATSMPGGDGPKVEHFSGSTQQLIGNNQELQGLDTSQNPSAVHLVHFESHADEDMDVEMEVDEETPAVQAAAGNLSSAEYSVVAGVVDELGPLLQRDLVSSDDFCPPPPPDEEWIPPPPPDAELVPPPPPPEEASVPSEPPYAETLPPHPYQEQYNVGYSVPANDYYAPARTEVANNSYYAPVDGGHIVEPQLLPYYNSVSAGAFPALDTQVIPAESVSYCNSTSENAPVAAGMGGVESSRFYVEAGSIGYLDNVALAAHNATVGPVADSWNTSLSTARLDSDSTSVINGMAAVVEAGPVSADVQPSEAALTKESTCDMLPPATSMNQAKAVRSKKRTIAVAPTLRSNKKVSSLVDKWKAAKEELHGEDDEEPENAYEVLERKRQKEIEKWRARQIASGEAQDNANFIPLAGDWRERVKRKKTEVKQGAKAEPIQIPAEPIVNDRRQPDLIELSKDLPPGWQAYWDEGTKEVYYGNTITSETTWTRPTR